MSQHDSDSDDAPLEISTKNVKKGDILQQASRKTHKIGKSGKGNNKDSSISLLKKQIKAELRQQFEEQKIMEQLKKVPLNFGERENKVIKIQDTVQQKKKISSIGVQVVHQIKRQNRRPDQKYKIKIDKQNPLRGGFDQIKAIKRAKK